LNSPTGRPIRKKKREKKKKKKKKNCVCIEQLSIGCAHHIGLLIQPCQFVNCVWMMAIMRSCCRVWPAIWPMRKRKKNKKKKKKKRECRV
jgi:hypothetical protein